MDIQTPDTVTVPEFTPPPPKKKRNFTLIIPVIVAFVLILLGVIKLDQWRVNKELHTQNSAPSPTQPQISYGPSPTPVDTSFPNIDYAANLKGKKIVYEKNNDLYYLDEKGMQKIVTSAKAREVKFSPEGNKVYWIEQNKIGQDQVMTTIGYQLRVYDLNTRQTTNVIPPNHPKSDLDKMYFNNSNDTSPYNLSSFDFYPNDPLKMVYIRDGVWLKDLKNNTDQQILKENYSKTIPAGGVRYWQVTSNPTKEFLLFRMSAWEGSGTSVYNLTTKTETNLPDISNTESSWSHNGDEILSEQGVGMFAGGFYITPLSTMVTQKVIDNEKIAQAEQVSFFGTTQDSKGVTYAFIGKPLGDPSYKVVNGLYKVSSNGSLEKIVDMQNETQFSPQNLELFNDGTAIYFESSPGSNIELFDIAHNKKITIANSASTFDIVK